MNVTSLIAPQALARVEAYAADADARGHLRGEDVAWLRSSGFLGWTVGTGFGGRGASAAELGSLHEQLGATCQSTRAVVTAHQLATAILDRWGTPDQKRTWLPALGSGVTLAAFAVTERHTGSDPAAITCRATRVDGGFRINGRKCWITSASIADVVLISAEIDGEPSTVLIPTRAPGLRVEPAPPLLGFRAAMVGDVVMNDVFVPEEAIVGPIGSGLMTMVGTGIELGRFITAWGGVGLVARLLREARMSVDRHTGGGRIVNPLVRRLLAQIRVGLESSRALCLRATVLRDAGDPAMIDAGVLAKYVSARAAASAARDAVQLLGAAGCVDTGVAARFFRDAKILEIIEGPQEVLEAVIGNMWHECLE